MSRAVDLIGQVERRGGGFGLGGPSGALVGPASAIADLLPQLRQHKAAIIAELRRRDSRRWRTEFLELGQQLGYPRVVNEPGVPISHRGPGGS